MNSRDLETFAPLAFRMKVAWANDDACWEWLGSTNEKGYGRYANGYAHRRAYEFARGPIRNGLTVDHLCRNRACVNPSHLELVTRGENNLRGSSPAASQKRQTHCKRGHRLVGNNLGLGSNGHRFCKPCRAILKLNSSRRIAGLPEVCVDEAASLIDFIVKPKRKYHFLTPLNTHCPSGHAFEGRNVMVESNGARKCRSCHNARRRKGARVV